MYPYEQCVCYFIFYFCCAAAAAAIRRLVSRAAAGRTATHNGSVYFMTFGVPLYSTMTNVCTSWQYVMPYLRPLLAYETLDRSGHA